MNEPNRENQTPLPEPMPLIANDLIGQYLSPEVLSGLRTQGYAPGGYLVNCYSCDRVHGADKRAIRCLNCAIIAAVEAVRAENDEPPPVDNDHVAPGCELFSGEAAALSSESPNISSELKTGGSEHSSGEAAADIKGCPTCKGYRCHLEGKACNKTAAALTAAEQRGAEKAEKRIAELEVEANGLTQAYWSADRRDCGPSQGGSLQGVHGLSLPKVLRWVGLRWIPARPDGNRGR